MTKKTTYDADSISVLEGLEAVRKRPGMYIGSVSRKGLNHLIYEIVDNSVDEHLAGFCSEICVFLEKDGSCTVSDNGTGLSAVLLDRLNQGQDISSSRDGSTKAEHGLGLKLVKQIVRAHKGTIQFSDSVPHGLTVQISLPGGK